MTAQYPSEIATLTNPISAEGLNQPTTGVPHSVIETRQNEEILAIETELGTGLKGSKSSLAERIAVGINEDGTLKSEAISIESLSDVTLLSGLSNGQLLYYNASLGEWINWTPDFSLADLSDVVNTAKATGKILQVNADGDHEYVDLPDPDVSGLVPYTGATTDVDLGAYDVTATDITAEGNLKILNEKFIQGRNYVDSAEVDILKVNTDDEVEAGANFVFGMLEFSSAIEPISPSQESTFMYQEATGVRPNRTISLLTKNELGEKVIISTTIV